MYANVFRGIFIEPRPRAAITTSGSGWTHAAALHAAEEDMPSLEILGHI